MSFCADGRQRQLPGRTRVLLLATAAAIAGVVLAGCTSGGGSTPPSPSRTRHHSSSSTPTTSSAAPSGPNACALVSSAQVGHALHEKIAQAKRTVRAGAPLCTWTNAAGKPVATLELSPEIDKMLLDNLANNGAYQPRGLHTMTVFAPRPPRMVIRAGSYGALLTLQPAWYQRYLLKGKTNPMSIPHSITVKPLMEIEGIVLKHS